MSGNAATRAARVAAGKCAVCLKRRARADHPTCRTCADRSLAADRARYQARRQAGLCVRCGLPARVDSDGAIRHLCHAHAAARRARRNPED